MLVFMLQPIFKPFLLFPIAMYPTKHVSGESLFPVIWKVFEALELHDLPVVSLTSDGASSNHRFYRLCQPTGAPDRISYKNPFADRDIYFFSDVPHLLKTARNSLSNSGAHLHSRNLQVSKTHTKIMEGTLAHQQDIRGL